MGILGLGVIDLDAAVRVLPADIHTLFLHERQQNLLSHLSQIAGNDLVIVLRRPPEIL